MKVDINNWEKVNTGKVGARKEAQTNGEVYRRGARDNSGHRPERSRKNVLIAKRLRNISKHEFIDEFEETDEDILNAFNEEVEILVKKNDKELTEEEIEAINKEIEEEYGL